MMLDVYLNERLIHFIANMFEKQDPLPSFEDFKAPKNKNIKSNKLSKEEKQKLKEESDRIKKKFSGGI